MKRGRLWSWLFVAATALSGCAASVPPSPSSAPRGGTLIVAWWNEPAGLMPYIVSQLPARILSHFAVEGLIAVSPDGEYQPWLAKQVPTLANGDVKVLPNGKLEVTYRLLAGVTWSDGKPFTSDDVKFTWQFVMKEPTVFSRDGYDRIESMDTPDLTTVVVHFDSIYAAFLTLFEHVLPRHVLDGVADVPKSDYARRPLGTGPFRITEFTAGDHLTMVRNPNFRRAGAPLLDGIIFRFIPSRTTALLQLKAGEVDAEQGLLESDAIELEKSGDVRLAIGSSSRVFRLEFNLAKPGNPADAQVPHPVLGDIAIRHALTLATPKRQLIDSILGGKAEVANSILSIGWAAPKDVLQEAYDPAKAKQILDAAGWTIGRDGVREKAGIRATLTVSAPTNDPVRERIEQVLIDEWRGIGVQLSIRNFPTAVLFAIDGPVRQGDFDMDMYAEAILIDPQARLVGRYHTKNIPGPSNKVGLNWNRYGTPDMDRLLDKAASVVDRAERAAIYRQILGMVNDLYLNVWLYTEQNIDGFRSNVGGYGRSNPWMTFGWDAENWHVRR